MARFPLPPRNARPPTTSRASYYSPERGTYHYYAAGSTLYPHDRPPRFDPCANLAIPLSINFCMDDFFPRSVCPEIQAKPSKPAEPAALIRVGPHIPARVYQDVSPPPAPARIFRHTHPHFPPHPPAFSTTPARICRHINLHLPTYRPIHVLDPPAPTRRSNRMRPHRPFPILTRTLPLHSRAASTRFAPHQPAPCRINPHTPATSTSTLGQRINPHELLQRICADPHKSATHWLFVPRGGCCICGNCLPSLLPRWGIPQLIFQVYVVISLHNCHFVNSSEMSKRLKR